MMEFNEDQLYFIPLGGCGVFGANLSLYGYGGKWLIVDCGMGFGDDTMPGVDIIVPNISFLKQIKDDILAMIVTHGHEDHIGGIEYLWPQIQAPIYATPFTAGLIHTKVSGKAWGNQVDIRFLPEDEPLKLDPFEIETIKMAHSIPEMRALNIKAGSEGYVLHTGDWKLDPNPVAGDVTDEGRLKELADLDILAVVGDSTNAMVPGHSGSEYTVEKNLTELFSTYKNKIFMTCFSSNVARLVSIAKAAAANDRHVSLVGRSLWRIEGVARQCGYLDGIEEFLDFEDAAYVPKEKIVYICTGSQGEPRAALSKVANGDHKVVDVVDGDVVLFSSRAIPGNEVSINRIKNRFLGKNIDIVTDRDEAIHVSGHPYQDEITQILEWVKPRYVLPVHGERMQMERHASLAEDCGIPAPVIPMNGDVCVIDRDGIEKIGEVPHGMLAVEGKRLVPVDHEAILMRKRLMYHGSVVVTLVMNDGGMLIADPKITAMGLFDDGDHMDDDTYTDGAIEAVKKGLSKLKDHNKNADHAIEEAARIAARRYFNTEFDKKPQTRVHLVRV